MIKILPLSTLCLTPSRSFLVCVMVLFFGVSWGQNFGDFRSKQSGNWNESSTWEQWDGAVWQNQAYEEIFPVIASSATSAKTTTTGTTHTVSLPSGIQERDLILIFWSDGTTSGTVPALPAGFTQLYSNSTGNRTRTAWFKVANGTEGTSISVTAGTERSAHVVLRVQAGTYSGIPFVSTIVASTNNVPNPGLLNPGQGINKFLWLAALHTDESSVVTAPTNYLFEANSQTISPTSNSTEQAQMVVASRELEVASEDPGSFSLNQATTSATYTIGLNSGFGLGTNSINFPQTVFPTVVSTASGAQSAADVTIHSISLPKAPKGDLLLVVFSVDGNPTVSVNTALSGSAWNELGQASNGNTVKGAIFWKIAEGSDVLTLSTSVAERSSHIVYRIKDGLSVSGSVTNGNGANSNPPSHTPSDGTRSYLWIATRSGDGNNVVASVFPTNFSNLITQGVANNGGANTNTAIRQFEANTLDPGSFTSPNEQWVSFTLAVRGSGTSTVSSNHIVTVTSDVSVPDLTVAANGTLQVSDNVTVTNPGSGLVTVNGTLQTGTNGSAIVSGSGTFTLSSGATLGITSPDGITTTGATGNIRVTGTRNFSAGANYIYNGNVNQVVGNGLPNPNSLTIANTGSSGNNTVTLTANEVVATDLRVTSGTFNLNSFTVNRASAGGTFELANNATLILSGTSNFPSNYSTIDIGCTSTVEYNASSAQTIAAVNYGSLVLSGAGEKTLSSSSSQICSNLTLSGTASTSAVVGLSIGGNVTLGAGTTFSAGTFTHTVGGNWSSQGTFNAGTSTIDFSGTTPGEVQNGNFHLLTFSGSGAKTLVGDISVGSNLLISNNLTASSGTITLSGNWVNNGTFVPGTSTLLLNGLNQQSLGGSNPTTFHNLIISNGSSDPGAGVVAGADLTVNGTLDLSKQDPNETNGLLEMVKTYGNYSNVFTPDNLKTVTFTQSHDILDSWVLTMGPSSATVGVGTVTGKVKRNSFAFGTEYTFGHANMSLTFFSFLASEAPSEIMVITTKGTDRGIHSNKSNTVARLFQIIRTGGTVNTTFSIKLNYEESELNGNSENQLVLWDHHIPYVSANTPHEHGKSDQNTDQNWVRLTNHSLFYLQTGEVIGGQTKYWMLANTLIEGNAWLGAVNTNWNVTSNWTKGVVPTSLDNVIINDTIVAPRIPVLPSTGANVSTLTILPNAKLNGGIGGLLRVHGGLKNNGGIGSWINNGQFIPGTSKVIFDFPRTSLLEDATVAGPTSFYDLEITAGTYWTPQQDANLKISGTLTNSGVVDAGNFENTIELNGAGSQVLTNGSGTFNGFSNLAFTGTGTKTITSTVPVAGNITPVAAPVVLTTGTSLTLNPNKVMEITSSGSVTTQSTSKVILETGSNYVNLSTSNPTLEVRQTIEGEKGWRMIGTPISTAYAQLTAGLETQGFTGSTNPTLQPNLLWWDETDKGTTLQGWRQPNNLTASVPAGRGHYFYVFNGESKPGGGLYTDALPKNLSVTGTEVNLESGNFNFGVTFTGRDSSLVVKGDSLVEINQAEQGFNLIANPTASTLDFYSASGWTKTNMDQSIYVWSPEDEEFLTWNGTTGTLGNGRLAPYQGFWVKANAANPVLALSGNGAKSLSSSNFFGRKLELQKPMEIQLNVAGEGLRAQSWITFDAEGKLDSDPKDAYQLESLSEDWLLLYSFGSPETKSPLVINHQPEVSEDSRIIPLHLAAAKKGEPFNGTYLLDWSIPTEWPTDREIVLMDHINQKAIDMRKEKFYSFSFEAPKATESNARKTSGNLLSPKPVIFSTPFALGDEELPQSQNARTAQGAKPKRPFTIYIGSFPGNQIEYLPEVPKLFAPVPNPFRTETKIKFFLPVAGSAQIKIYDLLGQEVGSFQSEIFNAGVQELDWKPASIHLPVGMYVIQLTTSQGQFTQKLIKN